MLCLSLRSSIHAFAALSVRIECKVRQKAIRVPEDGLITVKTFSVETLDTSHT